MPLTYERPPFTFLGATAGYVRNDLQTNGRWMRNAIARQINHLLARHPTVIPGKNLVGRTIRNSASSLRLWDTRLKSGVMLYELVVDVQLLPTDTAAGSPRWWIEVDGVSQGDQFHNVRCAAGSGTQFSDVFEMQQTITFSAKAATHKIELWTDDNCRVAGWDLHEKPREALDIANVAFDTFVDYSYALPVSAIRDDIVATSLLLLELVWETQRGQHLSWNVDDPASPIAVSSTVAADLWGASTVGPTAPTQYRNSYANENLLGGAPNKLIRTVCWVLGERTAGAGNVIGRFIGDNHAGGVDVNVNGALGIYTSSSFTLLPQAAGDCVRMKYLVSAGGTTGNIYAAGCYPQNL